MITGPVETVKQARKLRSEMSLPETVLWRELRKRPGGFKFRRQHPAGIYVLDFYNAATKLAIEVDGFAHDSLPAVERDRRRSSWLRSQGIATTRVPGQLILEDVATVVERIVEICGQLCALPTAPLHQTSSGPPPRAGEDL